MGGVGMGGVVSFSIDKYNDVTAPHCTFPSCIFSKSNNGLFLSRTPSPTTTTTTSSISMKTMLSGYYEALQQRRVPCRSPRLSAPFPSPTQV